MTIKCLQSPIRLVTSKLKSWCYYFSVTDQLSYCKRIRLLTTLSQSVLLDLDHDIDVEDIKEKYSSDLKSPGTYSSTTVERVVRTELDKRYLKFIKGFNESQTKLWKVVRLEQNFFYSEGYAIPPFKALSNRHWIEAMTISTMEERLLYYFSLQRLFDDQKRRRTVSISSDTKHTAQSAVEGENGVTIFLNVLPPSMEERLGNHKLVAAMQFGNPLVIDMGFEESSLSTDLEPLAYQLWEMYVTNRSSPNPFHLVFVNCVPSSPVYRYWMLHYMVKANFILATFTTESHTDIYPLHSCVYMSAQSKNALMKYHSDKVYILGAYHDPLVRKKYSIAKAGQDGIRCMRLPINEHVGWAHQAPKDLDMDRILQVFLYAKDGLCWKDAFCSSVPLLAKVKS